MPTEKGGAQVPRNTSSLFQSLGVVHRVAQYRRSAVIFAQGTECPEVMYLQQGSVKLSVLSPRGKEAIVSVLQPGDFFAEGCLAGQQLHIATAVAVNPSTVAVIDKTHMSEMLHTHPELNEQFLSHMLKRNIRIEEDLIDHLFNSVEKRLARTLLLLVTGGLALVGFLQFGTIGMTTAVAGVSLLITTLEGSILTPMLMGRAASMNQVAVFVGLLFWSWVWGVWGMLLAVPMMMVIKVICDHVEPLQPVGHLLGE